MVGHRLKIGKGYAMKAVVVLFVLLMATSAWSGSIVDDFSDGDFGGWTQ